MTQTEHPESALKLFGRWRFWSNLVGCVVVPAFAFLGLLTIVNSGFETAERASTLSTFGLPNDVWIAALATWIASLIGSLAGDTLDEGGALFLKDHADFTIGDMSALCGRFSMGVTSAFLAGAFEVRGASLTSPELLAAFALIGALIPYEVLSLLRAITRKFGNATNQKPAAKDTMEVK
ncbi:hypothetical protein [Ruegeria atlantica]|uniref:hypothetical protein n=1 Tax=Ruegeria atlantica TaxID=81569 RepID=UPI00147ED271|nr:hypothetical protein [Ruegeria atlantica]